MTKIFFFLGLVFLGVAAILWLAGKFQWPLGKLPGDVSIQGEGYSFSFPLMTCLLISVVLTILLNLFFWFSRKGGG